jgi:hypothetical protein
VLGAAVEDVAGDADDDDGAAEAVLPAELAIA